MEKVVTSHTETGGSKGRVTGRKVTGLLVLKETDRRAMASRQAAGHRETAGHNRHRVADRKETDRNARKVAGPRETGHSKTREASLTRTDLSNKVINRSKMLIISKIDLSSKAIGGSRQEK